MTHTFNAAMQALIIYVVEYSEDEVSDFKYVLLFKNSKFPTVKFKPNCDSCITALEHYIRSMQFKKKTNYLVPWLSGYIKQIDHL